MRPLLRPGTHVLRRGDGTVQLGLDPATAVVLADSPGLRTCLEAVAGAAPPTEPAARALLDLLREDGLLVDESVVMPLVGGRARRGSLPRHTGAALARAAGDSAGRAASSRARTRIHLADFGHSSRADLVTDLTALLARAGLRVRQPRADHVAGAAPVIGVLVGVGEPDRGLLDGWMREGTPFLVVRVTEGRTVVGPFVQPGATACVRCIDAHHTDTDPAWPLLVHQYSRAAAHDRRDGTTEPVDPAQVAAGLALAVRDIAAYADGGCPHTWSATYAVDLDLAQLRTQPWLRHPDCGCWWQ